MLALEDLDNLEDLAHCATEGKRRVEFTDVVYDDGEREVRGIYAGYERLIETDSGAYPPYQRDAEFIAACDPETILALIAMARREPRKTTMELIRAGIDAK